MNATLRRTFLILLACSISQAAVSDETNSVVPALSPEASNALLQIQQQLHDTQLAIEQTRQQAEADARRNADDLATRFQSLQQIIAVQRQGEIDAAQKTQQMIMMLGVSFGSVGLAVLLLMAYMQWRAISRLAELITLRQAELALDQGRVTHSLTAGAAVEQSNARLFAMVDQLEKRILELKQVARAPLAETNIPTATSEANGAAKAPSDRDECVANLVTEGQALLSANEPQKALECFDVALGLNPHNAEALVKKGGALEKLGRLDEAITCYDQAIEADGGMTIAYLHKGGLYNRLSRYDEALQCYERALQTQEKKAPGEKLVA